MKIIEFSDPFPAAQVVTTDSLTINLPFTPEQYYRHGWQSWSLTTWMPTVAKIPVQKPKILHPMQQDPGYAYHPYPNGSWVGAVEMDRDDILLLGSLGLDSHVELIKNQIHGWFESGTGDWFIGFGAEKTIFDRYTELLAERLGKAKNWSSPRIWCSWYSLYTAIDEDLIVNLINDLGDMPFDVVQVDDGWQVAVGDWVANPKFPSGMKALADKIKSTGRKAGVWLAPLIAVKTSKLFQENPGWFLVDENGKFVSAGFNWGEQLFALDTTQPDVLAWLVKLMGQIRKWGFEYVKLDFLYGGALPGMRHTDLPRESAYRNGLKVMRETLGKDVFLLTCGAPILPSLGLCDALRIGPDVSGEWENKRDAVLLYNPAIPGTRNAIRTSIHRKWLAPLVQTDPDVVYFNSAECKMNDEQRSLLKDLALICNFIGTSDLPQSLRPDERENIRTFLNLKPVINPISRYVYEVDGRIVDFSPAISLPGLPGGFDFVQGIIMGWLADQSWALKIFDALQKNALKKLVKNLKSS